MATYLAGRSPLFYERSDVDGTEAEVKRFRKLLKEELVEINPTLTVAIDGAPYRLLPYQYFPSPGVNHNPPIFCYGVLVSRNDLEEYLDATDPNIDIGPTIFHLMYKVASHLDETLGLSKARGDHIMTNLAAKAEGTRDDPTIIIRPVSNYRENVSTEQFERVQKHIEEVFDKKAMWWVSNTIYISEDSDYAVSEADVLAYHGLSPEE